TNINDLLCQIFNEDGPVFDAYTLESGLINNCELNSIDIERLSNGNILIVYEFFDDNYDIYFKVIRRDNTLVKGRTRVNTITPNFQRDVDIAVLTSGEI